jgi:NPCBM/NEW2 domain-containing protein
VPDQNASVPFPRCGAMRDAGVTASSMQTRASARPKDYTLWIGLGGAVSVVLMLGLACSACIVASMWINDKSAEVDENPNVARNVEPLKEAPAGQPLAVQHENEIPDPPGQRPFAVDPVLANAKDKVFLSDLQEFAWKPGPGDWRFGKNGELGSSWVPNGRILVNGAVPPKGLSMHPPIRGYTRVCYALNRTAKSVQGAVAMSEDERHSTPPPTRFLVLGDGKLLWRSASIKGWPAPQPFHVDVSKVDVLELRTYVEMGHFGAHAAWVDPYVER